MLLSKLKRNAEAHLGCPVTDAVVAVPAYFSSMQYQAMRDVGAIAGLNILRVIADASLAVVGHVVGRRIFTSDDHYVLALDVGGGGTSASVMRVESGVFEPVAMAGDRIGGLDMDNKLLEHFIQEISRRFNKGKFHPRVLWRYAEPILPPQIYLRILVPLLVYAVNANAPKEICRPVHRRSSTSNSPPTLSPSLQP